MSAITTPSQDLLARHAAAAAAKAAQPFTTFAAGHFVRPAVTAQPVARPFSFGLCDLFVAAPVELDYDEPNAVYDGELELVEPSAA